MRRGYISVRVALSDSVPNQDQVDGQLEVKKGQMLLLLYMYTPSQGWWEFKIKTNRQQNNGGSGFVPKENTREAQYISVATTCADFVAQVDGDLTVSKHETLMVYCTEGDWALVKGSQAAGYVPRKCIKLKHEMDRAAALFDFPGTEPGELSFKKGETLIVLDSKYGNWWRCMNPSYSIGLAPCSYIKLLTSSGSESGFTTRRIEGSTEPTPCKKDTLISDDKHMSIASYMAAHGCKDLSPTINYSAFSMSPVASGDSSTTFRGRFYDGTVIATKILWIPVGNPSQAQSLEEITCKLFIWSRCRHPNVLPLLGLAFFRERIGVVSPWMNNGRLPKYLEMFPRIDRLNLCIQICEGLWFLHKTGVIHGDLKAENILVSNEGVPLLSGFGYTSLNNSNQALRVVPPLTQRTSVSSIRWMAPEILAEAALPSTSSDVYALGMTLYEVMAGKIPYAGKREAAVLMYVAIKREPPERLEKGLISQEDTDKLWGVLLRCWSYEPASRPSAENVTETMIMIDTLSGLSRKMMLQAAQEVISHLVAHGCGDLSQQINSSSFGDYPIFHGGLSDIYRGRLLDGATVAVKVLRVSIDNITLGSKHLKHAARELHTWNKCSHPNIMPLLGLAVFRDRIGMVAPWMRNGNLPEYLKKTSGVDRHNMCVQICEGLSYLHQKRIVHCDLKGANVLVSDEGTALLTDFGTSLVLDRTLRFTATTGGPSYTLRWSPAEILKETSPHTEASDVYALGMTIYEIMAGKVPYHGKNDTAVLLKVINREYPERPKSMPRSGTYWEALAWNRRWDKLWELLVRCWAYEPKARPSAAEVTVAMRNAYTDK